MQLITSHRYVSKYSNVRSQLNAAHCIREYDSFGKEVPNFNIGGKTHINTAVGGFLTVMVLGLSLSYAGVKFVDLYEGSDPNIRENFIQDSFGADDYMTFTDDINFRLAVGARRPGEKTLIEPDP